MRSPFTAAELRKFRKIRDLYIADGYPEHKAEAHAWDIIYLEHNIKMGVLPKRLQEIQ